MKKLNGKLVESSREVYLDYVRRVLEKAIDKYEHRQTRNNQRIAWGRLIVQACKAGNDVLKDVVLEELAEEIEQLKERFHA